MNTAARLLAALILALGVVVPAAAQTDDLDAYANDYQAGNFGRVRFVEGRTTLLRADGQTETGDRAGVNAPIFPGDALRTDSGGRAEVQLADGTVVRVDRDSEVVFQSLPEPGAKYRDNTVLVLSGGVMRLASRDHGKDEIRIDTRDASIYLLGDAEVRVDVAGPGGTRVASVRGVAEVVGNDSSVLVRGGTGTSVAEGDAPAEPRSFSALTTDGFDRWCASRDASYRNVEHSASNDPYDRDEVPSEVQPYYNELSGYGSWTNVPTYGYVWYPHVATGWHPYTDGYWAYGPGGYFWVSYEPWGWAPYHYGNWQWVGSYGWCWVPGRVFAGAWVSWSWGSAYVGWAPLDYWGRPGWGGGPYYYGYYDPGCWTFVNYGHVASTHVGRYAVPVRDIGDDLRHANVVSRPPRVDPRRLASSREVRQKAFTDAGADRTARMRPIDRNQTPARTMVDVQQHLSQRRPARAAAPRGLERQNFEVGRRTFSAAPADREPVQHPRRIFEDPRAGEQRLRGSSQLAERRSAPAAGSQDNVRELYERMSRPRETKPQTPQDRVRPQPSRPQPKASQPQSSRPQQKASRPQPSRPQPQVERSIAPQRGPTRMDAPRPQGGGRPQGPSPRASAPSRPQQGQAQPRSQSKPQGGQGRAKPNNGHGNNKH